MSIPNVLSEKFFAVYLSAGMSATKKNSPDPEMQSFAIPGVALFRWNRSRRFGRSPVVPLSGLVIFHPKGTGSMSILVWAMVCLGFSRLWSLEFISGTTQTDSGHAAEYGMKTCGTMSAVQDVYQVRVNICITWTHSPMD